MRAAIAVLIACACGRVGLESRLYDAAAEPADTMLGIDASIDAISISHLCPQPVMCGDGCCAGDQGEMCSSCAADCAVTTPACGNGQCDPGEDSTSCYVDCGPTPWAWTTDETALLTAVNQARTGGTKCPGRPLTTAPAVPVDPTLVPAARDNVWEIAHQNYFQPSGAVCNGRTFGQLQTEYGFTAQATYFSGNTTATVANAMSVWLNSSTLCPIVMDPTLTGAAAVAARDVNAAFLLRVK
jgi:uncharacterized protein YkwD